MVTDTRGTLLWDKPAEGERPLLILTSCQASREYLDYLEGLNISWIACGEDKLDLVRACEILKEEFGVQRAAVVGGGHINAAFLADGLLDEVSILVGAGIDGRGGMAAVFDGLPMDRPVTPLKLGTWFIDDDKAAQAVREAVKLGYRLIDTAQAYGNERGVGEGVRTCGLPREQVFVASKVAAELKDYDSAAKSIDETLEKMGLDYLDQIIIHSPQPWTEFRVEKRYFEENRAVWRALEDAQAAGKVKVIGVSNFLRDDLENLLSDCRVRPMVNQILLHISNTDKALVDYCKEQNIQVEAYSPIAHGEALKNPAIAAMAQKYGVTAAQLCIRYVIQLGTVALPKTADPAHMKDNAAVDFVISDADMDALVNMDRIQSYGDFNIFPVFSGKPLA